MTQLDLLDGYPNKPGYKESRASIEAAERVAPSAKVVRTRVCLWLSSHHQTGGTAEMIASDLFAGDPGSKEYATFRNSVRSRLSELKAANKARRASTIVPGEKAHRYYLVESADGAH